MGKCRVLVTGAGGFIGARVVDELQKKDCEVVYFDLVKPKNKEINRIYRGTILDPVELTLAVRRCDYVIHLAALLGVQKTDNNRLECLHINNSGTINVIEAAVKEGVKKIVFSSSSEVYGKQEIFPITETNPLNPKSVYGVSKIVGEQYLQAYSEMYGIDYNIVRFFNVYGEYQREEFVMPKFVKRVVENQAPQVYGNGDQNRSFCYVEDAARGLVESLFTPYNGEIFNIGNSDEPISMKDLAYRIIKISKKKIEPEFLSYEQSDRKSSRDIEMRIPSTKKAEKMLGFKPLFPLNDGIKRLLNFYEKNKN